MPYSSRSRGIAVTGLGSRRSGTHRPYKSPPGFWAALALSAIFLCAPLAVFSRDTAGVFVDTVAAGSAAEKAGLRPGDRLVSWSAQQKSKNAGGTFTNVFQWYDFEIQQSLISPARITVERNGNRREILLPVGDWGVSVRPGMPGKAWATYLESRPYMRTKDPARGFALRSQAESMCVKKRAWDAVAWIALQTGMALAKVGRNAEVEQAYQRQCAASDRLGDPVAQCRARRAIAGFYEDLKDTPRAEARSEEALGWARKANQPLSVATCLNDLGLLAYGKGDLERAETMFREVCDIRKAEAPGTLLEAAGLNNMGVVLTARGRLPEARSFYERAVAIKGQWSPGSLDLASSLNNLGMAQQKSGDLQGAEITYLRSLEIKERLAPKSFDVAVTLNNLGALRQSLGDLPGAEAALKSALAIHESMDPESSQTAGTLQNLGMVANDRGDLSAAEGYWRRSLALLEKTMPGSLNLAWILHNLALLATVRQDYDEAERLYGKALEIKRRQAPDSLEVSSTLLELGVVSENRGNLDAAMTCYQEALTIREKLAPASLDVAAVLESLGGLEGLRKNRDAEEDAYKRALAISQQKAPGGLQEAEAHGDVGAYLRSKGDLAEASPHLEAAVQISRRLAPGSTGMALNCYSMARLLQERGNRKEALAYFREAVDALEAQRGKLGGGAQASEKFSAKYGEIYKALVDVLVEDGKPDEAFAALERYRARALLEMLAERDLDFRRDAPEAVLREKRILEHAYDAAQERLPELDPRTQAADVEAVLEKLTELRSKQAELVAQYRRENPRLAALQYPEPLSLKQAEASLPDGCLMLSYCAGEKRTLLFALLNGNLTTYSVPLEQDSLAKAVRAFRLLAANPGSGKAAARKGQELFARLVQPASGPLSRSRSVLLCLDGPLHGLPFAALQEKSGRFFGELHAFARTPSMTVYAEERHRPPPSGWKVPVVAFGDPVYSEQAQKEPGETRSAADRKQLAPLPFSRDEAEKVCALGGEGAVCLLGPEASERHALSLDASARCVHFACHGLLDEDFPLDSALALSADASGQDNGLLQAWEVFENVRLDADLVTLSACETALGKEMGGEGLIGLTRAFQYAGARSVLASLWSVSDASTAEFMARFYRHLFSGTPKSEALRLARAEMAHEKGAPSASYAHPAHWAGFELVGGGP